MRNTTARRYYVTFRDSFGQSYTIGANATAPRLALRNARRMLAKDGITGLKYVDVFRYIDTGERNENGALRLGIRRFALAWKY